MPRRRENSPARQATSRQPLGATKKAEPLRKLKWVGPPHNTMSTINTIGEKVCLPPHVPLKVKGVWQAVYGPMISCFKSLLTHWNTSPQNKNKWHTTLSANVCYHILTTAVKLILTRPASSVIVKELGNSSHTPHDINVIPFCRHVEVNKQFFVMFTILTIAVIYMF